MIRALKEYFPDFFIILILITLPIGGRAYNSSSIILFIIYALYQIFYKKQKFQFNILSVSLAFLFFLGVSSLLWTENVNFTQKAIVRFLPYVALGFIVCFNFKTRVILDVFAKSIVIIGFYCIVKGTISYFFNDDVEAFFYHSLSENLGDVNAIYLSIFVSFSILVFLYKNQKNKLDFLLSSFLIIFLVLLSSKMIIAITLLNFVLFFIRKKSITSSIKKNYLVLSVIIILIVIASLNLSKRIKVEFEKTKISEVLTTKDFGHVYLWTGFGLRAFQTKLFFEITAENKNYLLGTGLHNSQQSLDDKYKEYNLYPGFYGYNFHNQYLQVASELGLIGLFIMFYIFYLIFKESMVNKNYFLLSFIILIFTVCFTESFLWRQRGMVFFITISLLLYGRKYK